MFFYIIDDDTDEIYSKNIDLFFPFNVIEKNNILRYFFIKIILENDTIKNENKLIYLQNILNTGNIIVRDNEIYYYVRKGDVNKIYYPYQYNLDKFNSFLQEIPNLHIYNKQENYNLCISSQKIDFGNDFVYYFNHDIIKVFFYDLIINNSSNTKIKENCNISLFKFGLLYDIGNKLILNNLINDTNPTISYYEYIFNELFIRKYNIQITANNNVYLCY
jgi:hypothetical protein